MIELNKTQNAVLKVLKDTYKKDTVTRAEINALVKKKVIKNPSWLTSRERHRAHEKRPKWHRSDEAHMMKNCDGLSSCTVKSTVPMKSPKRRRHW